MKYQDLFNIIKCRCIIFFEDDFTWSNCEKSRVIYDFTRMDENDRRLIMNTVKEENIICFDQIANYDKEVGLVCNNEDWDKIAKGDICNAFHIWEKTKNVDGIIDAYQKVNEESLKLLYKVGKRFGISAEIPECFKDLFDEYIFQDEYKSFRIYTKFASEEVSYLGEDLKLGDELGSIVCIVDNYLAGENRGKEIVNCIKGYQKDNNQISAIGSIFSSKEECEVIDDYVYFEYISKENKNKLKDAIAESAYNFFLQRLKENMYSRLNSSFSRARKNKSLASFLSSKAKLEGITEYEIILEWIKLMCMLPSGDSQTELGIKKPPVDIDIKRLAELSKIINSLDSNEVIVDVELEKLNTLEAFEYSVNDFYKPIMPGDVFKNSNDEWFILVGQDCDTIYTEGRSRKNTIAVLLPIKLEKQKSFKKWENNQEKVLISNFRTTLDSPECYIFQVDYIHRKYISYEILSLCAYNKDGDCKIALNAQFDEEGKRLAPESTEIMYQKSQQFFLLVNNLDKTVEFRDFIKRASDPRQLSICEFEEREGTIFFDLRRVCRLRNTYVYYLYKLYLEYRGRQSFQTINLVQIYSKKIELKLQYNSKVASGEIEVHQVEDGKTNKEKKWIWFIKKEDINEELKNMEIKCKSNEDIQLKEDSIEIKREGKIWKFTKENNSLEILINDIKNN